MSSTPKLFSPIHLGQLDLTHRVVLAPLTRYRATKAHVHTDLAEKYYGSLGTLPGSLLITEGTFIAQKAGGYRNVPGIWNDEQVAAWKKVTDAVHANGSYIYMQLWALGRAANPKVLAEEDPENFQFLGASDVKMADTTETPRAMTVEEIKEFVGLYAQAAHNAVHRAGFDGVELHGANGYLIDQFIQPKTNTRTDEYGGSIEKRARFVLEVLDAVTKAVGQDRTGIRFSPWGRFMDIRGDEDVRPQFSYVVQQLAERFPSLSYLHLVEPRTSGDGTDFPDTTESNDFLRAIWKPEIRRLITAGGYKRQLAIDVAEKTGELIAFGRLYISNPDLPRRLKEDLPLTPSDRTKYYIPESPTGYIDWTYADGSPQVKL
ncbi:NADH:flavin oxidoreductase/NADH oxidase [Trametopsis cervina]|nr:NADH:flavin oxidoreductase/NADH oxidase [Trametopsis cervina]